MKVTEQFLKAKNSKELNAFLVIREPQGDEYIRLCFDVKNKITGNSEMIFVETPTRININICTGNTEPNRIAFHERSYHNGRTEHVRTFLKDIKKDSEVRFTVLVSNLSDWLRDANLTSHSLYGHIGEKNYLLSVYTGPDNLASPVKF